MSPEPDDNRRDSELPQGPSGRPAAPEPTIDELQSRIAELAAVNTRRNAENTALLGAALGLEARAATLQIDNRALTDRVASLELALRSSRDMQTAMGMLMERLHLSKDQAFTFLSEASKNAHTDLVGLAAHIAHTGDFS